MAQFVFHLKRYLLGAATKYWHGLKTSKIGTTPTLKPIETMLKWLEEKAFFMCVLDFNAKNTDINFCTRFFCIVHGPKEGYGTFPALPTLLVNGEDEACEISVDDKVHIVR